LEIQIKNLNIMKSLKSIFKLAPFVLVLCLAFNTNTIAQNEKATSPQIAGNQTEFIINELDLDAAKAKDLKSINDAYSDKMKQLMKKGSGASEEEIEALKRSHTNKIRSVLDIEEYEKYLLMTAKLKKEKEAKAMDKKNKY